MIKLIRQYLLKDKTVKEYVSNQYIFHEIKPEIDIQDYIILKDKPLNIGFIEEYQLDVIIYGKDLGKVLEVEKSIRTLLNDIRGDIKVIEGDRYIRDMTMLIGGGRQYDASLDRHISVQYFKITI